MFYLENLSSLFKHIIETLVSGFHHAIIKRPGLSWMQSKLDLYIFVFKKVFFYRKAPERLA